MQPNPTEVRFPCPNCGQKLACEDGYGGWRIQCPGCNGGVVVPLRSIAMRPTAVVILGSAPSGATTSSSGRGRAQPAQEFMERFAAGFGQALGGFVAAALGLLAVFGLLIGACALQVSSPALFVPVDLVIGVIVVLIAFSRVWDRLWE